MSDRNQNPESFYRPDAQSSYLPYRPHDNQQQDQAEHGTSQAASQPAAGSYETYSAPATRPPYPPDDDALDSNDATTHQSYQPYHPSSVAPNIPQAGRSDVPVITIEEPTPITPSNSLRRVPGSFPVDAPADRPSNISESAYENMAPSHPSHYNTSATQEVSYTPYQPPAVAHVPPPQVHVEEVSGPSELPLSYGSSPPQAAPASITAVYDTNTDDLYSNDTPVRTTVPTETVPSKATVHFADESGSAGPPGYEHTGSGEQYPQESSGKAAAAAGMTSSALPVYEHPEGVSVEHEPQRSEKAPIAANAEYHNEAPPPRYSTLEGISPIAGAQGTGKTPFSPISPIDEQTSAQSRPITQEFYAPEKPTSGLGFGSALGSAPNRPIPNTPPPLPPRRPFSANDNPLDPTHYLRDPHKLVAYLIPFPKPIDQGSNVPDRFLIYTPPPPPLSKPTEGEKESKAHKVQRKWQEEVRSAKTSTAKTASWAGVKSKATKGIDWAMSQTVSANLEFLTRLQPTTNDKADKTRSRSPSPSAKLEGRPSSEKDTHADDGIREDPTTHKTVGLEEMVLVYPLSMPGTPEQLRTEFVNTMLRSKSKGQRDAIIATGLLPVTFAIDMLAVVIWPFGGLFEVDAVWAYSSIRGARIARSTTKRLTSTGSPDSSNPDPDSDKQKLKLTFQPSERLSVLQRYLATLCHQRNAKRFPSPGPGTTESEVLEAIGWSPSVVQEGERNWEDEQWEITSVKEDLRQVMRKGAREWDRWVGKWEEDPRKAGRK